MFEEYTGNEQFDLQINRFMGDKFQNDSRAQKDLTEIIPKLTDIEGWFKAWHEKAVEREQNGDFDLASKYYQAAEFYLDDSSSYKNEMYQKYRENFYKSYDTSHLKMYEVPYEQSFLPAIRIGEDPKLPTTIFFAGYDSYIEELLPMIENVAKQLKHNIVLFEGPGQGSALKNGLKFIPNWEKPMKALLDYFDLDQVNIVGISWGGYFAIRAAAFEKRIDKVVCFDIFYSGLDTLKMKTNQKDWDSLMALMEAKEEEAVNQIFYKKMSQDLDLNWKIKKGMENTGEKTPFALIKNFEKHTMANLGPLVNQDVLLLAGEQDQYVPIERLPQIEKELVNAASVTSKVFTKETGGEQHCQAGYRHLAFDVINQFLTKK